ncbi:MAG: hypothetical protein JO029_16295 [Candidatus Eremiobacteraeota bacterium]|nr:hypothetical protein [Candidatus Eremiobacteraeota bacterium]MBV8332412.1 hypothetical protein [Candidatus Eremiobacteraeota bacterium]MBV8435844.1 hypothetical protein [Candidatus Eremiobacteraeota bacterium]MBV8582535.1 hypothetical protein [Candidatus Eremiobacteraeota bacterium]MBV8654619.1 hypothetical protein [Candidatus Eremiobacteraeota bacterium]
MTSQAETAPEGQAGFVGQIPPVEPLIAEVISTLSLAAHAYLTEAEGRNPDHASAEVAIDIASAAFERVKERLRSEERLAITQMLTETRMTFVRKRGI